MHSSIPRGFDHLGPLPSRHFVALAGDDSEFCCRMTECIRIDKYLWHARFAKSRALAQAAATSGMIRLNGQRVVKSSAEVKAGDILTLPRGAAVLVVRIEACGIRRGPAREAEALYTVLDNETLDRAAVRP